MRALLQRVGQARVEIQGQLHSQIGRGLLIFLGVEKEDTEGDLDWMIQKILNLRLFPDENGKMNRSIAETGGELLVVSQFTLCASTRKGNRPDFGPAADPRMAEALYNAMVEKLRRLHQPTVATGVFGAEMKVSLANEGPVTFLLDSKKSQS